MDVRLQQVAGRFYAYGLRTRKKPEPIPSVPGKWVTKKRRETSAERREREKTADGLSFLCVGIDLSSQSVARQVFSALVSLTSVFGMGTGGPSPLKTPTIDPR